MIEELQHEKTRERILINVLKYNVVSRRDQENTVKGLFFLDQEVCACSVVRGAK